MRPDMKPDTKTELIVATYENPRALALSLASVARQAVAPGGIAVADDGSGPETKAVIDAFALPTSGLEFGVTITEPADGSTVSDGESVTAGGSYAFPDLGEDDRVLEIGAGCGYAAAVLGRLAAEVHAVEVRGSLARAASENLRRAGCANGAGRPPECRNATRSPPPTPPAGPSNGLRGSARWSCCSSAPPRRRSSGSARTSSPTW